MKFEYKVSNEKKLKIKPSPSNSFHMKDVFLSNEKTTRDMC